MKTDLIIKIKEVEIISHPNADALEIALVGGWQTCVRKGSFKTGDKVVFVPPDAMLTLDFAEQLGVLPYLSIKKDEDRGRVRASRLRGEMSYGFVFSPEEVQMPLLENENLCELLNITKYEKPIKAYQGDQMQDHPLFKHNYNIQLYRNFPDVFGEGEKVWVFEKIDGTHAKVGWIKGEEDFLIGSHRTRRKLGQNSIYELPLKICWDILNTAREQAINGCYSYIIYGEIFGMGIASGSKALHYGRRTPEFIAFDIEANGKFLSPGNFRIQCAEFNIPTVPEIYWGEFRKSELEDYASGSTLLMEEEAHIREGIVIKPEEESSNPDLGRKVLKYLNQDYENNRRKDKK